MLIQIAWRNIWRHRTRSLVLIFAMGLGIWAGMVAIAFFNGMNEQRILDSTRFQTSHIQLHYPGFVDDPSAKKLIPKGDTIPGSLQKMIGIKTVSQRSSMEGLASTTTTNSGVQVLGVNPESESALTQLDKVIIEGEYFGDKIKNPVVIGKKLAERLNAKVKSKIKINLTDTSGTATTLVFKIAGIYQTTSSIFDMFTVFVKEKDLRKELNLDDPLVHEIAIVTDDFRKSDSVAKALKRKFPSLDVQTWADLAPEVGYANDMIGLFNMIFLGIILGALSLVIVNVMLMAVLERIREIGMLMALGMNRLRVFTLIVLETIFLACTGGPFGLLASWATIAALHKSGIDLSVFSEGLQSFGIANMIYPVISPEYYLKVPLLVVFTAILAAVYPAYKAVKMKPIDASRKIN